MKKFLLLTVAFLSIIEKSNSTPMRALLDELVSSPLGKSLYSLSKRSFSSHVHNSAKVVQNAQPYVYGTEELKRPYSHATKKGALQTFTIPNVTEPSPHNQELGRELIRALRTDGILQVSINERMREISDRALSTNKEFCKMPFNEKVQHVSHLTYSGYIASGEEQTDGKHDASEIFTITPDIEENDMRVKNQWPCHGPVPWPNESYKNAMKTLYA